MTSKIYEQIQFLLKRLKAVNIVSLDRLFRKLYRIFVGVITCQRTETFRNYSLIKFDHV